MNERIETLTVEILDAEHRTATQTNAVGIVGKIDALKVDHYGRRVASEHPIGKSIYLENRQLHIHPLPRAAGNHPDVVQSQGRLL